MAGETGPLDLVWVSTEPANRERERVGNLGTGAKGTSTMMQARRYSLSACEWRGGHQGMVACRRMRMHVAIEALHGI